MTSHRSKVVILGSGPAGATAAIYTARGNMSPIMVHGMQPGGQMTITTEVENYPGFEEVIQGPWLMEQMEKQAANVGTEIIHDHIAEADFSKRPFVLKGESGDEYIADTVVIATGAQAKWLGLNNKKKFQGYGVSGCATCDGFFF
ncbi:MAG: FAD-dependent oxidoreductase, partial [Rickettsiales bacterium]|nr:FAD-dependent oxidoreductase [Rickettsiales bacterium]